MILYFLGADGGAVFTSVVASGKGNQGGLFVSIFL